jgi:hypothetical protein
MPPLPSIWHFQLGGTTCFCGISFCGDDMLVLEGYEYFVDVSGLGCHCENQINTVNALVLQIAIVCPNSIFWIRACGDNNCG